MRADAFENSRRIRALLISTGALAIAMAGVVLVGWHTGDLRLTRLWTTSISMAYVTALALLGLGASMLALSLEQRMIALGAAAGAGVLSAVTVVEYAFGITSAVTDLAARIHRPAAAANVPMAPNTALCLLLLAAALSWTAWAGGFRRRVFLAAFPAAAAAGLGLISFSGYLTGFTTFGWGQSTPMALHTSAAIAVLGAAILALAYWGSQQSAPGQPSWLAFTATLLVIVMSISFWEALRNHERTHMEIAVGMELEKWKGDIVAQMGDRLKAIDGLVRRWQQGPPTQKDFELEGELLLGHDRDNAFLAWIDSNQGIRRLRPTSGNEYLIGSSLALDGRQRSAMKAARLSAKPVITPPVEMLTGGRGVCVYAPVCRKGACAGFVALGIRIQDVLAVLARPARASGYAVAVLDGEEEIWASPESTNFETDWMREAVVPVAGERWRVRIWPTQGTLRRMQSRVPEIFLGSNMLLACVLGLSIYLAQTASARRRTAEQAGVALQKEVDERRRAEAELDQFFKISVDMLCVADFDGRFRRLNMAWQQTLGFPLEHLLSQEFLDFVHPEDRDRTIAAVDEQLAGREVRTFENRYRTSDGGYRWMQWSSAPDNERRLLFAAARDVTAQKAAQEELRIAHEQLESRVRERTAELEHLNRVLQTSEEMFRRLFEDAPIGAAVIDADGRLIRANKAMADLLGYEPHEFSALRLSDVLHSGDLAETSDAINRIFTVQSAVCSTEARCVHRKGEIIWVHLTGTALERSQSGRSDAVVMLQDITERRRFEAQIRELNGQLETRVAELTVANHDLEAFTYSISHDLRAPLRHLNGFSRILLEQFQDSVPEQARGYLNRIRQAAERMGVMIDELLELSRIGRRELNLRLTGMRNVVEDAIRSLPAEAPAREIEWKVGDLPFMECDPGLAMHIFANLLSNAVKFTRPRRHAVIEIGHRMDGDEPVLFVRDNGVGFHMKYADQLFGVFQRLHRAEDFEGTGVGLATVQRIVQKHGGRIWAEAEVDRGATFYFTLHPNAAPATLREAENDCEECNVPR